MHKMFKSYKADLLLPNLDFLLRGLLGAAVGLQGLDDVDLPGVARPVLQDPLPLDPDPRPCLLGHLLVRLLVKKVKRGMKAIGYSNLFGKDLSSSWNVFSCS